MDSSKQVIATQAAPGAIGPYSQAVRSGGLLFTSGQIALDPATGQLAGDTLEVQTRQVLTNLQAVLQAGGSNLSRVLKTTVFLSDMGEFPAMNAIYAEFFSEGAEPARSTVQVSRLPMDVRVEIDCIALCD